MINNKLQMISNLNLISNTDSFVVNTAHDGNKHIQHMNEHNEGCNKEEENK